MDSGIHAMELEPVTFEPIWYGLKTYLACFDDRGFCPGDWLFLFNGQREICLRILYVESQNWLPNGWAILSFTQMWKLDRGGFVHGANVQRIH
ncbi:MAG: hypothetical protein R6U27_17565 [Desulfobacterales bacterium]